MARISLRFLTQNTHMIGDDRGGGRPQQWAGYLGNNFDIACLQEVWTDTPVKRLVDALETRPQVHSKNARKMLHSAGLVTLAFAGAIRARRSARYTRQAGWDRWANKGAILSEIEPVPGAGIVQVYNTHLNAARKRDRLNYNEARLVTVRQCFELARFIVRTRQPAAPALVCGDFNLDGESDTRFTIGEILSGENRRGLRTRFWDSFDNDQGPTVRSSLTNAVPADYARRRTFGARVSTKTQYEILRDLFRVLGFSDAWGERTRNKCYTVKLGRRKEENMRNDFRIRMPVIATPDRATGNLFAQDSPLVAPGAKRLDYLFVAPGDGSGPCTMRAGNVRRTYLPVPGQAPGLRATELRWLSDHIGLACTLTLG